MMRLLIPLGLLGLLGILALVIIYIIRPNYQVKHISTTYIWKMSLKYRKRKLPTSTLRNILLFLCQVFILTAIAGILAKPAIVYERSVDKTDIVAIVDSSASMYAQSEGRTRFQRAIDATVESAEEAIAAGGYASVILADDSPAYIAKRVSAKNRSELMDPLHDLQDDAYACSYGSSDIDTAIVLSQDVLAENPSAKIFLYTDKTYSYIPKNITVVPVGDREKEWNAAVLNATTSVENGFYTVTVQVACYGRDMDLDVILSVDGANATDAEGSGGRFSVTKTVFCDRDETKTVIFRAGGGGDTDRYFYYDLNDTKFYSYHSLTVSVEEQDSFLSDNNFSLYGGQKEIVRVLYSSSDPNPFFASALDTVRTRFAFRWDIQVTELRKGELGATSGYDFYIFEHRMPKILPNDGIVLLMDPDTEIAGASYTLQAVRDFSQYPNVYYTFQQEMEHPLLNNVYPSYIHVSRYTITEFDERYDVLMSVGGYPMLAVTNSGADKVIVMPFSVHYSNIAMLPEWMVLIYNIFDYYLPPTVDSTSFDVGQQISIYDRGPSATVTGEQLDEVYENFPTSFTAKIPGTYTIEQELYFGDKAECTVFVKIPSAESNIWGSEDALRDPYDETALEDVYDDLLIYLAAVLVGLLFAEWFLHTREER